MASTTSDVHNSVTYAFKGVECNPVTKAKLEMTEDEVSKLQSCLSSSLANSALFDQTDEQFAGNQSTKLMVIVDTDLGSDIDDALALLTLLHLNQADVEILGITTVYACTRIRTKICELIVQVIIIGLF